MRVPFLNEVLNKVLLVCAGIFAGLLFVEFALALFFHQPDFYFFEYAPGGYIFHKSNFENIVAEVPKNAKKIMIENRIVDLIIPTKQYLMPLRTNNAGFHNNESATYKKNKQYRILHLGDSLGFGFPFAYEESYVGQIENLLQDTEILNGSTVFTHTARLLQYYQKEGYKYNPDAVVAQLTISSPQEDYLRLDALGKSRFEFSVLDGLGQRNIFKSFITKDEAGIDQLDWSYSDKTAFLFDVLNKKLDPTVFFYHYFNSVRLLYDASEILKTPVKTIGDGYFMRVGPLTKSYHRINGYTDGNQLPFALINADNEVKNIDYKFTHAYLEAFKKLLEAGHKLLVVVVIPNRHGCSGATYPIWEKLFKKLADEGFNVINFYNDFCDAAVSQAREQFFLANEFHINTAGHKLIAERLAAEIIKLKNAR